MRGPADSTSIEFIPRYKRLLRRIDRIPGVRSASFFLINKTMACEYFPNANPIGRHVSAPGWDPDWRTIVGVTRDAKSSDLRKPRKPPEPMIYLPLYQEPEGRAAFEIRTAIDPHQTVRAILHAVKAVDSRLPVHNVRTLNEQADQ
ncbi:MAG TPA: hypothetical protein VF283_04280 [Bryobacteraceae bacterium]